MRKNTQHDVGILTMNRQQTNLRVFPSGKPFVEGVCRELARTMTACVEQNAVCTLVLAGGRTPKAVYARLAEQPFAEQIPWRHLHLYWGDERAVSPDHPDSNYRMVREALLDRVALPPENVHRIPTEWPPEEAARLYEEVLHRHFAGQMPGFDIVLLGLGTDGHTASLFPGSPLLRNRENWVAAGYVSEQLGWRISLTLPVLNAAQRVYFLVSGSEKAAIVKKLFQLPKPDADLPALLVQPASKRVWWFLDDAAASQLENTQ